MTTVIETSDANGDTTTGYQLGLGDLFQGLLNSSSDSDWVRLSASEGVPFTITMRSDSPIAAFNLELFDADGQAVSVELVENDDGSVSLSFTPTEDGFYFVGVANDSILAGTNYELSFAADRQTITLAEQDTSFIGTKAYEDITGNALDNVLGGYWGDDTISGLGGADRMKGGKGNDVLDGGAGQDALRGGAGNDILIGGADNDKLIGGKDADIFQFSPGGGRDTVIDFENGMDKLKFVGTSASSFDDLTITDHRKGVLIEVDDIVVLLRGDEFADIDASDFLFA